MAFKDSGNQPIDWTGGMDSRR